MTDSEQRRDIPVTAFVMTYNEARNLEECLRSVASRVDQIIVVDSFSTDATLEIARKFGADTYQHEFINYAKQYLWGMETCTFRNDWVIRLDADERWTPEGLEELSSLIRSNSCDGVSVRMKIYFMDRWIRRGGMYPNKFLRAYRRSKGQMEDRWMDEHIAVDGVVVDTTIDVLERNYDRQENIAVWTNKHNGYSTREALENLIARHDLRTLETIADLSGRSTERKRWMKENVYFRAPLFLRPMLYFIYRYVFRLGFMDGIEGFIFHVLHAFWYRFLVDVKIYQIERNAGRTHRTITETIEEHWGIQV